MTTDHSNILNQLAAGDISAEEAARRLRGGPGPRPTSQPEPAQPAALSANNHWLRIRVTDLRTGRQKVSVNLPLNLVTIGLKIGARYAPEVGNLNLEDILAELRAGTSGRIIDVEDMDDGERVEIFVE